MIKAPLNLPLVTESSAEPVWQGLRPAPGWEPAEAAPEPDLPQGEYAPESPTDNRQPGTRHRSSKRETELLSPAGGPDAAYAALHYGADAIYLGLQKFSARAEAENFTLEEVAEVTAYAHSLTPRRRVFVTINTLVRQDELAELVDDLAALDEIGVDALIVQDLGVWAIARQHFPKLELHASTQLAVHNSAGASTLAQLGFRRVVLARELTMEEVGEITSVGGVETEVFIHGALCYSYSGLCLFSSQTLGRSGNRGKCAYSCRDEFTVEHAPGELRDGTVTKRDPSKGLPFSMKDLALPDHLPALAEAGVSCFKIEGRKKSPLYVATTTRYYRNLLDHSLDSADRARREADLQTVFSRPWTHLFVQSHKDKEVADRDTTGHRGTPIGRVESRRGDRLIFTTNRALQRHDGLQIDLPGKPFGFALGRMWLLRGPRPRASVGAPAGTRVEIVLPADAPEFSPGATIYCSSSQTVKQKYPFSRPKPAAFRTRHRLDVTIDVSIDRIRATGRTIYGASATCKAAGEFHIAREAAVLPAVRSAFEKLGDTEFVLGDICLNNPDGRFVPISQLNQLRRELTAAMTPALAAARRGRKETIRDQVVAGSLRGLTPPAQKKTYAAFSWSVKVDRLEHIDEFAEEDWVRVDEVIVDIARDSLNELNERLPSLAQQIGKARIRLALPAITRKWEERGLVAKIDALRAAGWRNWEAANLSAWSFLGIDPNDPSKSGIDLATDWSVYVINRAAANAVADLGVSRFALSPEDGRTNVRSLLAEFADRAVLIVYQDTPLFIAESCAYANLIGGCPGKANCKFESMEMESGDGERVTALDYHCRTIVLNRGPFCLSPRLHEIAALGAKHLRADFIYRRYTPAEARDRWRAIRAGRVIPGGHAANFDRGIE